MSGGNRGVGIFTREWSFFPFSPASEMDSGDEREERELCYNFFCQGVAQPDKCTRLGCEWSAAQIGSPQSYSYFNLCLPTL